MYTMTFTDTTMNDIKTHSSTGRQIYSAVMCTFAGVFTPDNIYSDNTIPKIVCPYQVNDIFAIQEQWARNANEYVYKLDGDTSSGYVWRPASTMPLDAARFYGRIVSIYSRLLTRDIAETYLPIGDSINSCPGVAKVIKSYDSGNNLLSRIRETYSRDARNKSYQPRVTSPLPLVRYSTPYYLSTSTDKTYTPPGSSTVVSAGKSILAQAYETTMVHTSIGGASVVAGYRDADHNAYRKSWSKSWKPLRTDGVNPLSDPTFVGYTENEKMEIYYNLNSKGLRIPSIATYGSQVLDATQQLYVWLISAYLCDENGNIIGDMF